MGLEGKAYNSLETLNQAEQEVCNPEGLFETVSNKFKPQYNKTIKSLHFCKLVSNIMKMRKSRWADLAAIECDYKEIDRQLKEQYIHGLNDKDMTVEIIKEN